MSPNITSANIQLISLEFWRGLRSESTLKVVYLWFQRGHKGKLSSLHNYSGQLCLRSTCRLWGPHRKERKAHSKSRLLSLFQEADCFPLAGQAYAQTVFAFLLESKPLQRETCWDSQNMETSIFSFPSFLKNCIKFTSVSLKHHDKYLQQ